MNQSEYEIFPASSDPLPSTSERDSDEILFKGPAAPEVEFEYTSAVTAPEPMTIYLPPATSQEVIERLTDIPQTPTANTDKRAAWVQALQQSSSGAIYAGGYVEPLTSPEREWVQSINASTGKLMSNIPNMKRKPGVKLSGDWARRAVRSDLKMGVTFNVALWHSGFWLRLRSPTEREFLDLYQAIAAEKLALGRATYGLIFSNVSGYVTNILLDFVVEHIHDTSLALGEDEDIRKYIHIHDLPILYWGVACSHWSTGFQYSRPCIADPTSCNHVITERLNLKHLQLVDKSCLTERQRQHMTKVQPKSMTVESVAIYQDEFLKRGKTKITIEVTQGKIEMMLKNPNALDHIHSSHEWVNSLEEAYPASLGMNEKDRDKFLYNHGRATTMRQYGHFVQSITVADQIYDDPESIVGILDDLSAEEEIRKQYMKAVAKYIDDSVVSMIAIPTFNCPQCDGRQNVGRKDTKHPNWIPLSVETLFFHLLGQRVAMIENR